MQAKVPYKMQKLIYFHHAEIRTSTSLQLSCRSDMQCRALPQLNNDLSSDSHSSAAFLPQLLLLPWQGLHHLCEVLLH